MDKGEFKLWKPEAFGAPDWLRSGLKNESCREEGLVASGEASGCEAVPSWGVGVGAGDGFAFTSLSAARAGIPASLASSLFELIW